MPEECRFYYYDSGYSCVLKREKEGNSSIDSDTVHRYCWGYHYEECPRYKAGQSSGGCFLTSACVEAKGLPDNCYELTTLRKFRDEYLAKQEYGTREIAHYYLVAPLIVEQIKASQNASMILERIYNELVIPCVGYIEQNEFSKAYQLYKNQILMLEELYSL